MFLALGVVSALLESAKSGLGQVVDAAMIDGVSILAALNHAVLNTGAWRDNRRQNLMDGGAPFYTTYETSDGKYLAVGAVEEKFFANLLRVLDVDPALFNDRDDPQRGPQGTRRSPMYSLPEPATSGCRPSLASTPVSQLY